MVESKTSSEARVAANLENWEVGIGPPNKSLRVGLGFAAKSRGGRGV
jgi:hypothetical protein